MGQPRTGIGVNGKIWFPPKFIYLIYLSYKAIGWGTRMELTITSVDSAPPELEEQVPFKIRLLRRVPGTDSSDYWIGETLGPLYWVKDQQRIQVDNVVVWTRYRGAEIVPFARDLTIGLAYVTDPTQVTAAELDFDKCRYVAIAEANETSGDL